MENTKFINLGLIKFWVGEAALKLAVTFNLLLLSSDIKSTCCRKFRAHERVPKKQASPLSRNEHYQ